MPGGHSVSFVYSVCTCYDQCISVKASTMVSFQETIKQRELVQISCMPELDKKSVSIPKSCQ